MPIKTKEESINELHKIFVNLFDEIFGIVQDEKTEKYDLKEGSLDEVGLEVGYSKQYLGRLLNSKDTATIDSYKRAIRALKNIRIVKQFKTLKNRYQWLIAILVGMTVISLIAFTSAKLGLKKTKRELVNIRNTNVESIDGQKITAIYTEDQFKILGALAGKENFQKLSLIVINENKENQLLKSDNVVNGVEDLDDDGLTQAQKEQSIWKIKEKVRIILKENREKIENLRFMVNGKKNVVDFAHFIHDLDSLFVGSDQELATYTLGDSLPEHIKDSYFDIALLEIRNYLFDEARESTIQDVFLTASQNAQNRLEDKNVQLFHCYMKYGDDCFDHKRFNCYLECKDKCFDDEFFNEFLKDPERMRKTCR